MDLRDAERLANKLIYEYIPVELGWRFVWDTRPINRLGQTRPSRKEIALSVIPTRECTQEQVEDTIRHEIAHALVGPSHGHDKVWKAMARRVGAVASSAKSVSSPTLDAHFDRPYKWIATCPSCKRQSKKRRLSAEHLSGSYVCRLCKNANPHRPATDFVLRYVQQY